MMGTATYQPPADQRTLPRLLPTDEAGSPQLLITLLAQIAARQAAQDAPRATGGTAW